MSVCIYGAGAIGGYVGAKLALAGTEVTAIARGRTAHAIAAHGLRLQTAEGVLSAPVRVAEDPHTLGVQDVVFIAVKAPALASVAAAIGPLIGPQTTVVSAMNGVPWWFFEGFGGAHAGMQLASIDPDGAIARAIPAKQIVGAVVHMSCATPEPGLVKHRFGNRIMLGEPRGGGSARVERISADLQRAGFDTPVPPSIHYEIWYKLWGNMTMNPISAITGATGDKILDDPLVSRFILDAMGEAARIGARIGCGISQSGEERNAVTRELGAFKTSMLQDVEAGRPIELDALVSVVREIGLKVGEPTPNIDALLGITRLAAQVRGLY